MTIHPITVSELTGDQNDLITLSSVLKWTRGDDVFPLVAQALERMMSPAGPSPNPNVPSEYCSTIPPLQQARAAGTLNSPPPTVMVPVSVLKNPNNDSTLTLNYCALSVFHCGCCFPEPYPFQRRVFPVCYQVVLVNRSACGSLMASCPTERWQTPQSCRWRAAGARRSSVRPLRTKLQ